MVADYSCNPFDVRGVIEIMAGDAVSVTVTFARTLLSVTRVRRGGRYVIGKAPKVDLAVEIATAFTLVESVAHGFLVRIPHGVLAKSEGRPCEGAFVLARGQRIDLVIDMVSISIRHTAEPVAVMPRPAMSGRIIPFAVVALVAHLSVVGAAVLTASPEEITIPVVRAEPPKRVMPKQVPPPKPKPKPTPKREKSKQAASEAAAAAQVEPAPQTFATPEARQAAIDQAHEAGRSSATGIFGSLTPERLGQLMGSKDLAKELSDVGPIWDEDAEAAKGFGGAGGAFDPTKDPAFDSVKTGRFATVGSGRGAGANYRLPSHGKFHEVGTPPVMGLTCDDGACKTVGELDRLVVRDYVEKRYVDMLKCFERHGRKEQRIEVTLRFEIDNDGHAYEVSAGGASSFGSCVAKLVERTKFPTAKATQVTAYPIAFWRTTAG